jgi:hypothetical protein
MPRFADLKVGARSKTGTRPKGLTLVVKLVYIISKKIGENVQP